MRSKKATLKGEFVAFLGLRFQSKENFIRSQTMDPSSVADKRKKINKFGKCWSSLSRDNHAILCSKTSFETIKNQSHFGRAAHNCLLIEFHVFKTIAKKQEKCQKLEIDRFALAPKRKKEILGNFLPGKKIETKKGPRKEDKTTFVNCSLRELWILVRNWKFHHNGMSSHQTLSHCCNFFHLTKIP